MNNKEYINQTLTPKIIEKEVGYETIGKELSIMVEPIMQIEVVLKKCFY